ncbi:Cytochrome P450 - like 10 [Theobroma cacao]|nr:Cytochrome P450 - like 10 [Theobroma cacao]
MIPEMIVSVEKMLETWKHHEGKEIEVFDQFRLLTSEVISRTAFGSSYLEGKNIFDMLINYSVISQRNAFKMTMIINEALRLYPPAIGFIRKCEREVRLGKLILPANLNLFITNLAVHHDHQIWGDDSHVFNPERFSEGVAKGTNNNVATYFPFGIGPRTCVGFNFATVGTKVALAMILQHHTFTLSPAYVHSPVFHFTLVPQHGIQVLVDVYAEPNLLMAYGSITAVLYPSVASCNRCLEDVTVFYFLFLFREKALLRFFHRYWWIPFRIQYTMSLQGIKGPPYEFIHGNNKASTDMRMEAYRKPMAALTHDIVPRVMPQIYSWINIYGKNYLTWQGIRPQLVITEVELVKEVLRNSEGAFRKKKAEDFIHKIIGDGLVATEGEKWARQRKLANHAFHGESLKSMTPAVIASVEAMLEKWKGREGKEIEVFEEFRLLTSEVISRTAFEDLVDECKTFYFAGQETTNSLLAWTVLVLAIHTDWQEKARREVIEVFGNKNPHSEGIANLKTMNLIINETLRLYPPVVATVREVGKEVHLGKLVLPDNIEVLIPNMALHHDPDLWGDDAHLFKPDRFAEGTAKATQYNAAAFIPFSLGPRSCVATTWNSSNASFTIGWCLKFLIRLAASRLVELILECAATSVQDGKIYLSWNGVRALLVITEPDLIKEVLKNSEKAFPKRKVTYFLSKILGDGLATTVREKWARQRKLANYAFHGESLKVKLPMKTTVL